MNKQGQLPFSRMLSRAVIAFNMSFSEASNLSYAQYMNLLSVYNEMNTLEKNKTTADITTEEILRVAYEGEQSIKNNRKF